MRRRLSLRARLVLGVILLAAAGLAVANVVTYTSLRSFLLDRTDASLEQQQQGRRPLFDACREGRRPPPGARPGDYLEVRVDGEVACSLQVTSFDGETPSPPALPDSLEAPPPGEAELLTVDAQDGESRYRARVANGDRPGALLVAATPLDDVDDTLTRLLAIEALVTAFVLAGLALLGLWVVRLGLRPLHAIETTAAAIAGGDLSQRVERADPETEVGRLGIALNTMLARIEAAFDAQAASERRLRRFVADASHELRTPLAAVRAYAELFDRGAGERPHDLARTMSGISRESERMTLLVEDLLLLARLDEGRPLEREPVDLDAVVSEAVETARAVEPERPVELRCEAVRVVGDRDRLRQSVDNLLANVRAHTPPGTPVEVSVGARDGEAVVTVTDAGPGLAAEDAARVFERFYRADDSRSRASGGVGLGLSIVAAVAEAHGGRVDVRSRPGDGATFTIALPLAPAPAAVPARAV